MRPLLFILLLGLSSAALAESQFKVLVFSKTAGFRHKSIPDGIAAMKKMASENNFAVDASEDSKVFTDENLKQYYDIYQCPLDNERTHTGALGDNYAINSYATNSLWSWYTPQDTTPLNTDFGINSKFIGRQMSEIKSDTIILMEGMQSRVGFSWWSALETHNNQNMLDIQDFDQHKNGKMNFLFNDGSAAAKNNIIVNETSEYLKIK